MIELSEPSRDLAARALRKVGVEERLVGITMSGMAGNSPFPLYSLEQAANFLGMSNWKGAMHPSSRTSVAYIEPKALKRWVDEVFGDTELAQARRGDDGLRSAIRGLMQGDGFHDFLIRGANDRLLTDAMFTTINFNAINVGTHAYPATLERLKTAINRNFPTVEDPFWSWNLDNVFGFARAPLELIAYIVENDRPYSEIVTADYTMANRASAETMLADELTFDQRVVEDIAAVVHG